MKKVFGLKWLGDNRIRKPLYDNITDATRVKNQLENTMTPFQKFLSMLTYGKWVVVEMDVMERGVDI